MCTMLTIFPSYFFAAFGTCKQTVNGNTYAGRLIENTNKDNNTLCRRFVINHKFRWKHRKNKNK